MLNIRPFVLAAALVPLAAGASGQVTQPMGPEPDPVVAMPADPPQSRFIASGLFGSAFGDEVDEASFNFTGTIGYMWTQRIGAEFMAGFSPNTTLAGRTDTSVNSYMVNAIAALPLGLDGRWQPYISGGIGGLTLGSIDNAEFQAPSETTFAGNIGFGVMAYADQVGFRADVRRLGQLGDAANDSPILNDVAFWRANVGIAVRW